MPTNPRSPQLRSRQSSRRSSRRAFIVTAGTALSAPIAAAAATAPAAPVVNDPAARLARLEAVEAIRALNQRYAHSVNAGERDTLAALFADPASAAIDPAVRSVTIDALGEDDVIAVAPDGRSATARLNRVVEAVDDIGPACPLVEMAREQGGGVVRRLDRVRFENTYVKRDGAWKIQRAAFRADALE